MTTKSKKYHYVPQSILRRFTGKGEDGKLYTFDKKSRRSFASAVRKAGAENAFNTVTVGGEVYNFEPIFQEADALTAALLNDLVDRQSLDLEDHEWRLEHDDFLLSTRASHPNQEKTR